MRSSSVRELAEPVAPGAGRRGLLGLEQLPFANGGGIGDRAGQLDLRAGKAGGEMIERPFVAGQEAQVGLDILDGQLPRRLIGFRDGPDQAALAQHERINLELQPGEGAVIEAQLDLRRASSCGLSGSSARPKRTFSATMP